MDENHEVALSAWRQDAAARLLTYVGLRESGLIGTPTQVDVTLIMPTLAMLDQDAAGEYLERCELCGEPIPDGAKVAAVEIEPEYTRDACAKCLRPRNLHEGRNRRCRRHSQGARRLSYSR